MKTCYFVALLCLLLFSCGKETPQAVTPATPLAKAPQNKLLSELDTFYLGGRLVRIQKATKRDFDRLYTPAVDTSETANLSRDSRWVTRMGDTLVFKTDARDVLVVNNETEGAEENFAHYEYCGLVHNMDQFLIAGTYYEAYDYLLVDKKTGDITHLWGWPVASPNGKLFIAGNCDLVAGFTYNGLQLYKNTHKPALVAQRELKSWGAYDIKWQDNNTLMVEVGVSDENAEHLEHTEYFKLTFE